MGKLEQKGKYYYLMWTQGIFRRKNYRLRITKKDYDDLIWEQRVKTAIDDIISMMPLTVTAGLVASIVKKLQPKETEKQ